MPSDDSFGIGPEVQNSLPITSESSALNPQVDQSMRYPLRSRKEPDKFGFLKSSNVVNSFFDFISNHRLIKVHLGFALQLFLVSISSHFQEAHANLN